MASSTADRERFELQFESPPIEATLLRRYKRFLADVRLADGAEMTVHVPNTGSMMGCAEPGSRVWIRDSGNPERKYRYSWELTEVAPGIPVGINTGRSNRLVREAVEAGVIAELTGYGSIRPEVRYGNQRSRIDLLLEEGDARCYVEVKNVTAAVEDGIAVFPDAVSSRGTKHLHELAAMVAEGARGVLCYCVQRADVSEVRPADAIDPEYGRVLREVTAAGVETIAYGAEVSVDGIRLVRPLPVVCPPAEAA